MKVGDRHYRSIWYEDGSVRIIDQTALPHALEIITLESWQDAARAIRTMQVRGAPLIGVTAAWGMALAARDDSSMERLEEVSAALLATRPTAINLRWALERVELALRDAAPDDRARVAEQLAAEMSEEDVAINRAIGEHGLEVLKDHASRLGPDRPLNILTHCNAGWLATVDYGTALSPLFRAHDEGLRIHVWVDETRPRNQGAGLTAWELASHGIPHHVIVDNAGGHLMQTGRVDLCLTGTDRVARNGDVCNKIGTYLKALAAKDNAVPFYVALPTPTIDLSISEGSMIPIEERAEEEVTMIRGIDEAGDIRSVRVTPESSGAKNYGFDVTPARLVTALITERGVIHPDEESLLAMKEPS